MKKIGIIICGRYQSCGGGKCLRALRERVGAFSIYPKDEDVELVGYSFCGGCPGGNVEYVPEEMIKNGADVIHLATGHRSGSGIPPLPPNPSFQAVHREPLRHSRSNRNPSHPVEVHAGTRRPAVLEAKQHGAAGGRPDEGRPGPAGRLQLRTGHRHAHL